MLKTPIKVAVTGAAGQISYSLLFRIASGNFLGHDQPIELSLLEITPAMKSLQGVVMELHDCAFPLLSSVSISDKAEEAFADIDCAFLVGARPRGAGMERKDLLEANAAIFSVQGKALDSSAKKSVRVLVVGNPANTNALIAQSNAPSIEPAQFSAMTRLDANRAVALLASETNSRTTDIDKVTIWGNHSATQYPDFHHATVGEKKAIDLIDEKRYRQKLIPEVQKRGAAIIDARGASSAASAASAAIDHMREWALGNKNQWTSMAVRGVNPYGISQDVFYSYPLTCKGGDWQIIDNLSVSEYSFEQMKITEKELLEERASIEHLLT